MLPGTSLLLAGVSGGLLLRRVLATLGAESEPARSALDQASLSVGDLPAGLSVSGDGRTFSTFGLGSELQLATAAGSIPLITASSLLMAGIVVLFNRLVWLPLYRMAETRYTLDR